MGAVLIVANWDWVIYNFRLHLAQALAEEGFRITFVCPDGDYVRRLQSYGFRWRNWPLNRRSVSPPQEMAAIWQLAKIYAEERPSILHHDTIKPNTYGPIAVRIAELRCREKLDVQIVNSYMGLGYLFSRKARARSLRMLLLPILRYILRDERIYSTFSNRADLDLFRRLGLTLPDRSNTLVSEFVDTDTYFPRSTANRGTPVVLMAARLLWDKGIREFVDASRQLKQSGKQVEFWVAGVPDKEAPGYVPENKLRRWEEEGLIRWLGHRSDMPTLLRDVDIAALPTHYNEGMPRFLVEAAATGLPIVCTDIPACRQVVHDQVNGFCIQERNSDLLADRIARLVDDLSLRYRMGRSSRDMACQLFSKGAHLVNWLDLYRRLAYRKAS